MNEEITECLEVIKSACGSVNANLETHQRIQGSILGVESELTRLYALEADHKKQEEAEKETPTQRETTTIPSKK